jgi:hypothetical protein
MRNIAFKSLLLNTLRFSSCNDPGAGNSLIGCLASPKAQPEMG